MKLLDKLKKMMAKDAEFIAKKDADYNSSWKKRGGVGAYMMLARKWDRIEEQAQRFDWDIFEALKHDDVGLIDDIIDLSGYLYLVRSEGVFLEDEELLIRAMSEPESQGYVNQDGPVLDDDVWNNMAADQAVKSGIIPTINVGDTELLDFYEIVHRHGTDYEDMYNLKQDLRVHYGCLRTRVRPPKSLEMIATDHPCLQSYRDPTSQTIHRMPDKPPQGCRDC